MKTKKTAYCFGRVPGIPPIMEVYEVVDPIKDLWRRANEPVVQTLCHVVWKFCQNHQNTLLINFKEFGYHLRGKMYLVFNDPSINKNIAGDHWRGVLLERDQQYRYAPSQYFAENLRALLKAAEQLSLDCSEIKEALSLLEA